MMFAIPLAVAIIATALSPAVADNACFKSPTSGLTDPMAILGTHIGKQELVANFLSKFKRGAALKGFLDAINAASTSTHPVCGMVSWELAFFTSSFLSKNEPQRICCLSEVVDKAIDYDKTGNKNNARCVIDLMMSNTEDAVHSTVDLLLEQFGCGGMYKKPTVNIPACVNVNCASGGRVNNWDDMFKIIKRDFDHDKIPMFDSFNRDVQGHFKSNDKNRWGMSLASVGVWLHTTYLHKFGLAQDPIVLGVAVKLVKFMEVIAYAKPCNCHQRHDLLSQYGHDLIESVRADMALIHSKI